jgi:hypothetical protein
MINIYRDLSANAIFIKDENGAQFLNSIQATLLNPAGTKVSIFDLAREIYLVYEVEYTEFIDENTQPWGSSAANVVNSLNAIFQSTGTPTGNPPVITSNTSINATTGDTINYELTATGGVAYEWGNLPTGLTTVDGNIRKLIGGSNLIAGVYTPTMKAINYNGEDVQTLTINIANPPYSNTKSTNFLQNDYLNANASGLASVLGRTGNGSGSSDAWTICLWLKPGTNTSGGKQTIFYFGDSDHDNAGHIWIYYKGNEQAVYLEYGSKNNYIRLKTANNSLSVGTWKQLIFKYDGGTTGSSSGSVNSYYSRFEVLINNVVQTTTNSNGNFGWSSSINANVLQIGKRADGNDWMKNNCRVDEVHCFDVESTEDLYNGGVPFDMSTLVDPPNNGWRMGDGDVYPLIQDVFGLANFTMNNMTSANFINDVP